MSRIAPEELADVNDVLFGEKRWSGPVIAENLGVRHHTLWSWLNRRGLPADVALRLASEVDRRAAQLIRVSGVLRRVARDSMAEGEAEVVPAAAADE